MKNQTFLLLLIFSFACTKNSRNNTQDNTFHPEYLTGQWESTVYLDATAVKKMRRRRNVWFFMVGKVDSDLTPQQT